MEGEIMSVIKKWVEGEINNFIKVWLSVYISLCYSYFAGKIVPKGTPRLLSVLPVISLFLVLPLNLHSMHLGVMSAFLIAWLSNFKLLMFAFGTGPLSDPSLSLFRFLAIAALPIKIQQNPPLENQNKESPAPNRHYKENSSPKNPRKGLNSPLNYTSKALLVALFLRVYDYSEYIHPKVILFIHGFHIYFCLEVMLAIVATMAQTLIGIELEAQFNEPYLSTSMQDFWGRRWNVMVTRILHPTVYVPTRNVLSRILGRQVSSLLAILATFLVSALMHELIFYYLGRMKPTWKITWFFLLHGVCLVVEIAIKKAVNGRWQLPPLISRPLTSIIIFATGILLFLPEFSRFKADVRALEEYTAVGAFLKDVGNVLAVKYSTF